MPDEEKNLTPQKKSIPWRNIGILCSGFAAVVFILVFGFVVKNLFEVNRQILKLENSHQMDKQALESQLRQTDHLLTWVNELRGETSTIKQTVSQINQSKQLSEEHWKVAYTYYLAKLADQNIRYTHDLPSAIALLQTADQTLQSVSGTAVISIRQALAHDIALLESTPSVDIEGLFTRLNALHQEVDQWVMLEPVTFGEKKPTIEQSPPASWKKAWDKTLQTLKQLVVVHYNEEQTIPVLPEQRILIKQNIHAEINQAIWGLLHGQEEVYLSALNQLQLLLKNNASPEDTLTQAMLLQTNRLKEIYVRPPTPKLTVLDSFKIPSL